MLMDRNYIVQEIYGGLANTKFTTLNSAFPDYAKYVDVVAALEAKYAYNPEKAKEVITAEMEAMGAILVRWQVAVQGSELSHHRPDPHRR